MNGPVKATELIDQLAVARVGDRDDTWARALWTAIAEPGDRVAGALVHSHGAVVALELLREGRLRLAVTTEVAAAALDAAARRWTPRLATASDALESAQRAGARVLTPGMPGWPARADDLGACAPLALWVRGDAGLLDHPGPNVAIVGARAATAYGEQIAMELAAELAAGGVNVVSGAAYGIDGAAHRAALDVGGSTTALLAGGVDRAYPAGNADLLRRITARGVVAAEVPCGASPTKWRFLARNRLIAALADAVVVVEAGWRSGSINTANHAAELGRPLGVVPGPVTSATSQGCHRLLREADAQCVTNADEVRELLGMGGADRHPRAGSRTNEATRVLDALPSRGGRPTEDVARRAGLAPDEVGAILALLELEGAVRRSERGWARGTEPTG